MGIVAVVSLAHAPKFGRGTQQLGHNLFVGEAVGNHFRRRTDDPRSFIPKSIECLDRRHEAGVEQNPVEHIGRKRCCEVDRFQISRRGLARILPEPFGRRPRIPDAGRRTREIARSRGGHPCQSVRPKNQPVTVGRSNPPHEGEHLAHDLRRSRVMRPRPRIERLAARSRDFHQAGVFPRSVRVGKHTCMRRSGRHTHDHGVEVRADVTRKIIVPGHIGQNHTRSLRVRSRLPVFRAGSQNEQQQKYVTYRHSHRFRINTPIFRHSPGLHNPGTSTAARHS